EHGRRRVELLRIIEAAAEVDMAFQAIRGNSDGIAIVRDRVVDAPAIAQVVSEREMRLEQPGSERNGAAKDLLRTLGVAGVFQPDSIVDPERAERWSQFDSALELCEPGSPFRLLFEETEIREGGREGWLDRKDASIERLGLGELSGLVQPHG